MRANVAKLNHSIGALHRYQCPRYFLPVNAHLISVFECLIFTGALSFGSFFTFASRSFRPSRTFLVSLRSALFLANVTDRLLDLAIGFLQYPRRFVLGFVNDLFLFRFDIASHFFVVLDQFTELVLTLR